VSPVEQDHREAGVDALDGQLPPAETLPPLARFTGPFRTRAALGLEAAPAPALLFVPAGFVLGPRALGVLGADALAFLDVAVSVGLAALGIFIGLALDLRHRGGRRLLAAASAEALVTLSVVASAMLFLIGRWQMPLDVSPVIAALVLGVSAAASSASAAERRSDPVQPLATRIADLDDVLPLVLGAYALALVGQPDPAAAAWLTAATAAAGLAVGAAGWLLFEEASGPAERGVFVLGAVVLLGGSAAYLGQSALFAGMLAGLAWRLAPGRADRIIRDDLRRIQHPLVVLLLLVAGASLAPSRAALWLLAPLVLFRLAGKLLGGWAASRLAPGRTTPADLGAYLVPPGVIGIGFALAFHQFQPSPTGAAILTATAIAALAGELLAVAALAELRRA
jgi:hypothetical protein